ncbi:helix-turn-helix domain-containing protein [Actinokineospora sp. PR83]|uniref:PucR family transcriptional regulator n=1 Tax=Actinokineospora sp. PR83 TaxID=2884908 RepID=UPI0027DF830E|nr:helix-turn-helix domain-containing protein [Actinokineospora sp. PR83]MCG8918131.1 helix-turn-helix domain-containing protein [Actinokineospora sp. PR83]
MANATVRSHVDDLERSADVHERLTKLVLQGKGVDEVATATATAVPGHVLVLDEHGTAVATSGGADRAGEPELAGIGAEARTSGHTLLRGRLCAFPIITESEPLGTVVHLGPAPISDTDRRILERAALVAALVLVTRRRMGEAEARVRGELLRDLLTQQTTDHDLLRTLEVSCATNQNTRGTAQELHLHPNTVSQRSARISRLLGETWRQADHLLEIQVALRLHRVSTT